MRRMYIYANCLNGESISFVGKYLRDLETKNWHYYLREDGELIHVKKDGSMIVIGGTEEEVRQSQLNPDGFSE